MQNYINYQMEYYVSNKEKTELAIHREAGVAAMAIARMEAAAKKVQEDQEKGAPTGSTSS